MDNLSTFFVSIDGMPCTNRCQHCWAHGNVNHACVPDEQLVFVLDRLAEVHATGTQTPFFFYDEPTFHPQFVELMEHAAALGIIPDEYFMPTNGSILAKASDETWQRLKAAGVNSLQFTFYGLSDTHDTFAARKGAFAHIVEAIQRAGQHEVGWYAGVVVHPGNVDELDQTVAFVRNLAPDNNGHVGAFPFLWQGRGREANRIRETDRNRFGYQLAPVWQTEHGIVTQILDTPELANKCASEPVCEALAVHVNRDLGVFCGAACDSGGVAAAVPELRSAFALGTLEPAGFLPLIERYHADPPRGIALLHQITWGELAERYGSQENDEIYFLYDLPSNKWAAQYLLDELV